MVRSSSRFHPGSKAEFVIATVILLATIGGGYYAYASYQNANFASTGNSMCIYATDANTNQVVNYCSSTKLAQIQSKPLSAVAVLPNGQNVVLFNSSTIPPKSGSLKFTIQHTVNLNGLQFSTETIQHTTTLFLNGNVLQSNTTTPISFTTPPSGATVGSITVSGQAAQTALAVTAAATQTLSLSDVGNVHLITTQSVFDYVYGCPYGTLYQPSTQIPCSNTPASKIPFNMGNMTLQYKAQSPPAPTVTVTSVTTGAQVSASTITTTNSQCPAGTSWGGYDANNAVNCIPVTVSQSSGTPIVIQVLQNNIQCTNGQTYAGGVTPVTHGLGGGVTANPTCPDGSMGQIVSTPVMGASVSVTCCYQYNAYNPSNSAVAILNQPSITPSSFRGTTDASGQVYFSVAAVTLGSMNGYFVVPGGTIALCCQPIPLQPKYIITVTYNGQTVQNTLTLSQPLATSYTFTTSVSSSAFQLYTTNSQTVIPVCKPSRGC